MNKNQEVIGDYRTLASDYTEYNETIGSLDLQMFYRIGLNDYKLKTWSSDTHYHSSFEIFLLFEGSVILACNSGEYNLTKDDICIIPPILSHSIHPVGNIQRKFSIKILYKRNKTVQDDGKDLYKMFDDIFSNITEPIVIHKCSDIMKHVVNAYEIANSTSLVKNYIEKLYLSTFIIELFQKLHLTRFNVYYDNDGNSRLNPMLTSLNMRDQSIELFIYNNYNKDITLTHLAEYLCLSEKQSNRILSYRRRGPGRGSGFCCGSNGQLPRKCY